MQVRKPNLLKFVAHLVSDGFLSDTVCTLLAGARDYGYADYRIRDIVRYTDTAVDP